MGLQFHLPLCITIIFSTFALHFPGVEIESVPYVIPRQLTYC